MVTTLKLKQLAKEITSIKPFSLIHLDCVGWAECNVVTAILWSGERITGHDTSLTYLTKVLNGVFFIQMWTRKPPNHKQKNMRKHILGPSY